MVAVALNGLVYIRFNVKGTLFDRCVFLRFRRKIVPRTNFLCRLSTKTYGVSTKLRKKKEKKQVYDGRRSQFMILDRTSYQKKIIHRTISLSLSILVRFSWRLEAYRLEIRTYCCNTPSKKIRDFSHTYRFRLTYFVLTILFCPVRVKTL